MEVKISTKFDLGDTIFFISEATKRIIEATVIEILFFVEKRKTTIYYKTEPYSMVREDMSFETKEEIINSLNE